MPYPHTIYVSEVNQLTSGAMRLWYTHTDAFGEFRMEEFRCTIERDPQTGRQFLSEVRMGEKIYIDQETLKNWNGAIPYFEVATFEPKTPLSVIVIATAFPSASSTLK